ncbi:MAG TPA: DUF4870 domain-containing protein [Steroidobacteraceae bacterium]|nr:DUF4870 domain-containing protein [Steroidobacteraceae bacterium]
MNDSKPSAGAAAAEPLAVPSQEERGWGMLAHLSAFAGLIMPVAGNVLGPLLIWYLRREQSAFVSEQAKEALNFNICVLIGFAVCGVLTLLLVGFLLGMGLLVFWIAATIIAGLKAGEGVHYRYPFSVRFVK